MQSAGGRFELAGLLVDANLGPAAPWCSASTQSPAPYTGRVRLVDTSPKPRLPFPTEIGGGASSARLIMYVERLEVVRVSYGRSRCPGREANRGRLDAEQLRRDERERVLRALAISVVAQRSV